MKVWYTAHVPLVTDVNETTNFLAHRMLINTLTAIEPPSDRREARA